MNLRNLKYAELTEIFVYLLFGYQASTHDEYKKMLLDFIDFIQHVVIIPLL